MAGSEPAQKARLGKTEETDERRLIEAAQQDRARFADVYERYFELVYAYVARRNSILMSPMTRYTASCTSSASHTTVSRRAPTCLRNSVSC